MSQPNLTTFAAEADAEGQAAVITLRDRAGQPYVGHGNAAVTASVLGWYSAPVQAAYKAAIRKQVADSGVDVALAGLTAWGIEAEDGTPVPLTRENVKAVFAAAPWIMDQIDAAMRSHARFFGATSTA